MAEALMKSFADEDNNWTDPLVRQYFETAQSGFPYITCPDELRPLNEIVDSWWVIYAPGITGGVIVEGVRIDQWRTLQQRLVIIWCLIGLVLYMLAFGLPFGWIIVFAIVWISMLFLSSYLFGNTILADRAWIPFPPALQEALRRGNELRETGKANDRRTEQASEGFGRIAGGVTGFFVEASVGKAAGKFSEMAIEAACKALAEKILHRG